MDQGVAEYTVSSPETRIPQERHQWYQLNNFLLDLGREASDLELKPDELIHVGGGALFYHAYKAFGSKAVANFRGTHDLDIISFSSGSLQRALEFMANEERTNIRKFSVEHSPMKDKKTVTVFLDEVNRGAINQFEIDYWESSRGDLLFNNRVFSKGKLILDPPISMELTTLNRNKTRGLVTVPSLRDFFNMKADVVDNSNSGLRTKDRLDLLTILPIADEIGYDFRFLLDSVRESNSYPAALRRLEALEKVYASPLEDIKILGRTNPLVPTDEQMKRMVRYIGYEGE